MTVATEPQGSASHPSGDRPRARKSLHAFGLVLGGLLIAIIFAALTVEGVAVRLFLLRAVLLFMVAGEGGAGLMFLFRTRAYAESNGRAYDAVYHGVMQDFGFYNLTISALLATVALNPLQYRTLLNVVLGLYVVHGTAHVLRYAGLFFGGEIRVRPREYELRDALTLLVPVAALLLLYPRGAGPV